MKFKRKKKAVQVLTAVLTLCMIFVTAFIGASPAAASTGSAGNDETLKEEYAACGIRMEDGSYYYKDKRVKVLKDQSPDSSFYKFDPELKGTVSIKVIRNKKGNIKRVSYLTRKQAARLIERAGLKDPDGYQTD